MIDLNTLISNALVAAVQQATAPLVERIATLELQRGEMQRTIVTYSERIAALEEKVNFLEDQAVVTSNATDTRISRLENNPAQGVDMTLEQRVAALESETQGDNRYLNRDDVASLIEEAMDSHCSDYDHDDYDNHIGDDDKHFDGDIEDAVRDALSNMTFDVSIR